MVSEIEPARTAAPVPRTVIQGRAHRIAITLKHLLADGDQFISLVRRYDIQSAILTLEEIANAK